MWWRRSSFLLAEQYDCDNNFLSIENTTVYLEYTEVFYNTQKSKVYLKYTNVYLEYTKVYLEYTKVHSSVRDLFDRVIPIWYFGWYWLVFSRYFTNRYQRKTWLVHFGIKKLAGALIHTH